MKTSLAFCKKVHFAEVVTNFKKQNIAFFWGSHTSTSTSITKFRCKKAALLNFMFPLGEGHGEKTWKIWWEEEEGEKAQWERERDNNFVWVGDRERVGEEKNEYIDRLVWVVVVVCSCVRVCMRVCLCVCVCEQCNVVEGEKKSAKTEIERHRQTERECVCVWR